MTRHLAIVLSLCSLLFAGCETKAPSPSSQAPAAAPTSAKAAPGATGAPSDPARAAAPRASGAASAAPACPPPKQTTDVCAAVMVYVKIGGTCCAYGSPCSAPPGPQFSDSACTSPMH